MKIDCMMSLLGGREGEGVVLSEDKTVYWVCVVVERGRG